MVSVLFDTFGFSFTFVPYSPIRLYNPLLGLSRRGLPAICFGKKIAHHSVRSSFCSLITVLASTTSRAITGSFQRSHLIAGVVLGVYLSSSLVAP